ncbi:hypothetical protein [Epilithonimonas lactis]|uniref:Uncharacterized protein n=1 Tax=Epilithonimonas lactis TaxID=421072 RepID=A0A085BJ98_9FLAO|nr:hypothetical protein [Epilithonimonas lactis]KFC22543.1 hypothetical protein IO89_05650 [Epilithonimonas lactis]SEQ79891.1 hypothetical protein SAMN04488097_3042 [Epilithonimonas lactis]
MNLSLFYIGGGILLITFFITVAKSIAKSFKKKKYLQLIISFFTLGIGIYGITIIDSNDTNLFFYFSVCILSIITSLLLLLTNYEGPKNYSFEPKEDIPDIKKSIILILISILLYILGILHLTNKFIEIFLLALFFLFYIKGIYGVILNFNKKK